MAKRTARESIRVLLRQLQQRYDGLTYFRINPLGAYLFGQSAEYEPVRPADESFFVVSADRRLKLLDPARLTPVVAARLAQLATPEADQVYRLDDQKILAALDEGMDVETMRDFLTRRNRGPLPAEVDEWIARLDANSRAFSIKSNPLLIRAGSVDLAQAVLADAALGKYTKALDDRTLVIPASYETRFRNRLRELGYGVRR